MCLKEKEIMFKAERNLIYIAFQTRKMPKYFRPECISRDYDSCDKSQCIVYGFYTYVYKLPCLQHESNISRLILKCTHRQENLHASP